MTIIYRISDHPSLVDRRKIKILKSLRKNVDNWRSKERRREFLRRLVSQFTEWKGRLPNLRDCFKSREIERLLVDSIKCREGYAFVKFVARSGYRDVPKLDENGETILRRATPLHRAARRSRGGIRHRGLVRELFKIYRRFDLNYVDELGMTHLHVACVYSCRTALKRFLKLGRVDPNCRLERTGDSPLHLALDQDRGPCEETIRLLLRHGADPNAANLDGRTPLHVICARESGVENSVDLAKLFFDVANDEMGQQQVVRVDARDNWGRTPLQLAVSRGYPARDLMELLLRRGADPNAASSEGLTALHVASAKSDLLAESLFDVCDELNRPLRLEARDCSNRTPLFHAAHERIYETVELLLIRGADPGVADTDGLTPLHVICQRCALDDSFASIFFEICDEIHRSVRIDARDKRGRTPLQFAVQNFSPDTVDVLLNRGADLASFVFPTTSAGFETPLYGNELVGDTFSTETIPIRADAVAAVLERLENGGYELDLDDALVLMKLFAERRLLLKTPDLQRYLCAKEEFLAEEKKIMIKPDLSFWDLVKLPVGEAAKRVTCFEYFKFSQELDYWSRYRSHCELHMCEVMPRKFFRRWALEPFMELTHCRLPILCCEMIIDNLINDDLVHICLAVADQSS